jgi:hypothetical protein
MAAAVASPAPAPTFGTSAADQSLQQELIPLQNDFCGDCHKFFDGSAADHVGKCPSAKIVTPPAAMSSASTSAGNAKPKLKKACWVKCAIHKQLDKPSGLLLEQCRLQRGGCYIHFYKKNNVS